MTRVQREAGPTSSVCPTHVRWDSVEWAWCTSQQRGDQDMHRSSDHYPCLPYNKKHTQLSGLLAARLSCGQHRAAVCAAAQHDSTQRKAKSRGGRSRRLPQPATQPNPIQGPCMPHGAPTARTCVRTTATHTASQGPGYWLLGRGLQQLAHQGMAAP